MNPPTLTPEQELLLKEADFAQLYIWYNELASGINANMDVLRLYTYINKLMMEKA